MTLNECTTADESLDPEAAVREQRMALGRAHRLANSTSRAARPLRHPIRAVALTRRTDAASWADINCVQIPIACTGMYLHMDGHGMAADSMEYCK